MTSGFSESGDHPCVRVPREAGEETRERLADHGILDGDRAIEATDDAVFVPVTDPAAVPEDLRVVDRATGERDQQATPADLLGYQPTYERLGRLILLDEYDDERAREIADAVIAADVPCDAVLARASKVRGEYRVREWRLLAGDTTETVHREYGHEFRVDPTEVYFSPRLATERHRVIERVEPDERVVDMFAGVGPFAVPMASRGAEVIGCDLNPAAVQFLAENARRNGVADRLTAVEGDVRELPRDPADRTTPLRVVRADDRTDSTEGTDSTGGTDSTEGIDSTDRKETSETDGRETSETDATDGSGTDEAVTGTGGPNAAGAAADATVPSYRDWADRLVANLPHSADEFLETAVALAGDDCLLHYYDIQHEDDPFGPGERAIREAADGYRVEFPDRQVVRSYAPHELNVRLDARLRRE